MHHLKETVIDGVKFVLIPEELHDALVSFCHPREFNMHQHERVVRLWTEYDPEIFNAL
jgi:hypothetical protein